VGIKPIERAFRLRCGHREARHEPSTSAVGRFDEDGQVERRGDAASRWSGSVTVSYLEKVFRRVSRVTSIRLGSTSTSKAPSSRVAVSASPSRHERTSPTRLTRTSPGYLHNDRPVKWSHRPKSWADSDAAPAGYHQGARARGAARRRRVHASQHGGRQPSLELGLAADGVATGHEHLGPAEGAGSWSISPDVRAAVRDGWWRERELQRGREPAILANPPSGFSARDEHDLEANQQYGSPSSLRGRRGYRRRSQRPRDAHGQGHVQV
jgi:hypothetical protein